jgi:hypothetical protein
MLLSHLISSKIIPFNLSHVSDRLIKGVKIKRWLNQSVDFMVMEQQNVLHL